jgi:hypothetical protein
MPLVSTLELRRFDLIDVATVIGFYMFLRCRRCKLQSTSLQESSK